MGEGISPDGGRNFPRWGKEFPTTGRRRQSAISIASIREDSSSS